MPGTMATVTFHGPQWISPPLSAAIVTLRHRRAADDFSHTNLNGCGGSQSTQWRGSADQWKSPSGDNLTAIPTPVKGPL